MAVDTGRRPYRRPRRASARRNELARMLRAFRHEARAGELEASGGRGSNRGGPDETRRADRRAASGSKVPPMRLGEALARRSDVQKRLAQLADRLRASAVVQEGSNPP